MGNKKSLSKRNTDIVIKESDVEVKIAIIRKQSVIADADVAEVAKEQHLEEMEEKLKEHWDKKGWE